MPLRKVILWKKLPVLILSVIIILFHNSAYCVNEQTSIALEDDPRMIAVNPVTNRAVVTHQHSNSVSIVDLNTERIITELRVGRLPKGAAIDTVINTAVITNQIDRSVTLIDLNTNKVTATIDIGRIPNNVAVNSQTHIAAVTSAIDQQVSFVDLITQKVVAKTVVGIAAGDVAIDPVRNIALVLNKLNKTVTIIDMNNYRVSYSIHLDKRPQAIDVNPETNTTLVTNYQDNSVTIIDLLTKRSTIMPVEKKPLDAAFNIIDNRAVVLCDKDKKLLLLDLNTNQIINTYSLPRHPKSVAVNSIRNIAIVADDETDGLTIIPLPLSPTLPKIQITSPVDNAQIYSRTVDVSGSVERSTSVTVNGTTTSVSGNAFSTELILSAGQNTIAAIATDKYGRTTCHSILVNINTGEVTGTVTNALTGWLLPFAILTITDSKGNTQTLTTIVSGTFNAEIAAGTFSGSVVKPWYLPYSFSGAVTVGGTSTINIPLIPAPPSISNITVTDITENSAKITWETDQLTGGSIDFGKTTAYGTILSDSIEEAKHSIPLANLLPATTYHFRVYAVSANGTSAVSNDVTFKTKGNIEIAINSPTEGTVINGNSIIVAGSIVNTANVETGITVNGITAALINNQFAINNVPLNEGQNTISINATDVNGTTVTKSIVVNATIPDNFIKLSVFPESGIAPLTVSFVISAVLSNTILNYQIDFDGDGIIDYNGPTFDNISYTYTSEGIYYPQIIVTDTSGNSYTGSVTIIIQSKSQLENIIKAKWEGMKSALLAGKIDEALSYILPGNQGKYSQIFTSMGQSKITSIFSGINSVYVANAYGRVISCGALRTETGGTYSYPLIFVQDNNGIWKIFEF